MNLSMYLQKIIEEVIKLEDDENSSLAKSAVEELSIRYMNVEEIRSSRISEKMIIQVPIKNQIFLKVEIVSSFSAECKINEFLGKETKNRF